MQARDAATQCKLSERATAAVRDAHKGSPVLSKLRDMTLAAGGWRLASLTVGAHGTKCLGPVCCQETRPFDVAR